MQYLNSTWNVLLELSPWLLFGAIAAGLLHVLLPDDFLKRRLTGKYGVLRAVGLGVPLPLCSCGVIPVGLSLKSNGASNGAVIGFLISTPQTGVDSLFVSASMLGWPFAFFKLISAALTGLFGGWLTDAIEGPAPPALSVIQSEEIRQRGLKSMLLHALEMIHSIWRWLLFGVLVSAAIDAFMPANSLANLAAYGDLAAMLLTLLLSIPLYVCATASVPIAAALVAAGLPAGAALVFLMAGPATNVATLGAVYRTLGAKLLALYLSVVILGSIGCGLAFGGLVKPGNHLLAHQHLTQSWWALASAVVLIALMLWFAMQDARRFFQPAENPSCCQH